MGDPKTFTLSDKELSHICEGLEHLGDYLKEADIDEEELEIVDNLLDKLRK